MNSVYIRLNIGLLVGFIATVGTADVFRFDDASTLGHSWKDGENWRNQTEDNRKGDIPGPGDTVRFNYGGKGGVLDFDAGRVQHLQIGIDDEGGRLILDPGARLTVLGEPNYIGWMGRSEGGTLIVNGGYLNYKGWVSVANTGKGTFILNDGEVRVENVFFHDLRMGGGAALSQIRSGTLDVNSMKLNAGVMDISGGVVRIRAGISETQVNEWIRNRLLTINQSSQPVKGRDYSVHAWGTQGLEIRVPADVQAGAQIIDEPLGLLL